MGENTTRTARHSQNFANESEIKRLGTALPFDPRASEMDSLHL